MAILKRIAAMLAIAVCASAQAAPPTEYEVKAAFIHNIALFVEWPSTPPVSGSAKLCLLGHDPFGNALDMLQDMRVGKLKWEVVPARSGASLKECRVLFIAASEHDNLDRILTNIGNSPVLTVGDTEGYAERGVVVNFYMEKNKVRFEINREAAARAGLSISSQLLKLARIVPGGTR